MTYYHGTDADLAVGDTLVPGTALTVVRNYGNSDHVFMTCDAAVGRDIALGEAYAWAATACMVAEDEDRAENPTAHVYIVEPLGPVTPDRSPDEGVGPESCRTSTARIIGEVPAAALWRFVRYGPAYLPVAGDADA